MTTHFRILANVAKKEFASGGEFERLCPRPCPCPCPPSLSVGPPLPFSSSWPSCCCSLSASFSFLLPSLPSPSLGFLCVLALSQPLSPLRSLDWATPSHSSMGVGSPGRGSMALTNRK